MLPVKCELIYPCNKRCIPPRLLVWFFSKPSLFLVCKFINMEEVITYQLLHQTAEISFRFFFHWVQERDCQCLGRQFCCWRCQHRGSGKRVVAGKPCLAYLACSWGPSKNLSGSSFWDAMLPPLDMSWLDALWSVLCAWDIHARPQDSREFLLFWCFLTLSGWRGHHQKNLQTGQFWVAGHKWHHVHQWPEKLTYVYEINLHGLECLQVGGPTSPAASCSEHGNYHPCRSCRIYWAHKTGKLKAFFLKHLIPVLILHRGLLNHCHWCHLHWDLCEIFSPCCLAC